MESQHYYIRYKTLKNRYLEKKNQLSQYTAVEVADILGRHRIPRNTAQQGGSPDKVSEEIRSDDIHAIFKIEKPGRNSYIVKLTCRPRKKKYIDVERNIYHYFSQEQNGFFNNKRCVPYLVHQFSKKPIIKQNKNKTSLVYLEFTDQGQQVSINLDVSHHMKEFTTRNFRLETAVCSGFVIDYLPPTQVHAEKLVPGFHSFDKQISAFQDIQKDLQQMPYLIKKFPEEIRHLYDRYVGLVDRIIRWEEEKNTLETKQQEISPEIATLTNHIKEASIECIQFLTKSSHQSDINTLLEELQETLNHVELKTDVIRQQLQQLQQQQKEQQKEQKEQPEQQEVGGKAHVLTILEALISCLVSLDQTNVDTLFDTLSKDPDATLPKNILEEIKRIYTWKDENDDTLTKKETVEASLQTNQKSQLEAKENFSKYVQKTLTETTTKHPYLFQLVSVAVIWYILSQTESLSLEIPSFLMGPFIKGITDFFSAPKITTKLEEIESSYIFNKKTKKHLQDIFTICLEQFIEERNRQTLQLYVESTVPIISHLSDNHYFLHGDLYPGNVLCRGTNHQLNGTTISQEGPKINNRDYGPIIIYDFDFSSLLGQKDCISKNFWKMYGWSKKSKNRLKQKLKTKQPSGKLIQFCLKFDCIRIFVGLLEQLNLTKLRFYRFLEKIPVDQHKFSLQDKDMLTSTLTEWYLNCLRFSKNSVDSLDIHSATLGYLVHIMKNLKLEIANPSVFLYGEGGFSEMISNLH